MIHLPENIANKVNFIIGNNFKVLNHPIVINDKNKKKINKKVLGDIVFNNLSSKNFLENLIHPIIHKKRELFIQQNISSSLIALDVPLLFETKLDKTCDFIFLANARNEIQTSRVLERKNMTHEKFDLIKKNQLSNEERLKLSSKIFVVTTNYGKLISFIIILGCLFKILFLTNKGR